MPAKVDTENCTGCADCVAACPTEGTITIESEKALVNEAECIECAACVDACTHGAIKME